MEFSGLSRIRAVKRVFDELEDCLSFPVQYEFSLRYNISYTMVISTNNIHLRQRPGKQKQKLLRFLNY